MMHTRDISNKQGFTLVELAIVLVIIGLIVGGVLAGQALIRSSEIRAVISEHDRVEAAFNTFRERYRAIPGDMRNATDYWGAAHATPATCITTNSGDKTTCNGNGDHRIWVPLEALGDSYETLRAWQHLGNAELVPGTYSGVAGPQGVIDEVIGVNVPATKIAEATWMLEFLPSMSAATIAGFGGAFDMMFPGPNGQLLIFGALVDAPGVNGIPAGPIFTAVETMSLDQKIDDGTPGRGVVKSWAPVAAGGVFDNTCATTNDPMTAVYNADSDTARCTLVFRMKL